MKMEINFYKKIKMLFLIIIFWNQGITKICLVKIQINLWALWIRLFKIKILLILIKFLKTKINIISFKFKLQ
jgi:hypothetical protein